MSAVAFSWMYGDPALCCDRLRSMHDRLAVAEQELRERERRHKARRIRKLVKLAKQRKLKGLE